MATPSKVSKTNPPDVVQSTLHNVGFVHNLSSLQKSQRSGKSFFSGQLQSPSGFVRIVGFNEEQLKNLGYAAKDKQLIRIHGNVKPDGRNKDDMVLLISEKTRIEHVHEDIGLTWAAVEEPSILKIKSPDCLIGMDEGIKVEVSGIVSSKEILPTTGMYRIALFTVLTSEDTEVEIKFWGQNIDSYNVGDILHIIAKTNVYMGKTQLNASIISGATIESELLTTLKNKVKSITAAKTIKVVKKVGSVSNLSVTSNVTCPSCKTETRDPVISTTPKGRTFFKCPKCNSRNANVEPAVHVDFEASGQSFSAPASVITGTTTDEDALTNFFMDNDEFEISAIGGAVVCITGQ